jgi:hypothetical protein
MPTKKPAAGTGGLDGSYPLPLPPTPSYAIGAGASC